MACFHPLRAYRLRGGDITFAESRDCVKSLDIPCGRCIGCRLERSRQWAVRCVAEAQMHERNCFATLTYANAPFSLDYHHYQLFMRRLRRKCPTVRFFMCGEYGDENWRPHYHALLFGYRPADAVLFSKREEISLYASAELQELWPHGFVTFGDVTFDSAGYVARYAMKKITGDLARQHYSFVDPITGEMHERVPEFGHMSLKPGIGATWLERYQADVYPEGKIVANGVKCKPPRYFDKRYQKAFEEEFSYLQMQRELDARLFAPHNTDERLAVREIVQTARIRSLKKEL